MMFALGSWQMSLVMLGAVPFLAATSAVKKRAIEGKRRVDGEADGGSAKSKQSLVRAGAIVAEVVSCNRTVAAFGAGEHFYSTYSVEVGRVRTEALRTSWVNGMQSQRPDSGSRPSCSARLFRA